MASRKKSKVWVDKENLAKHLGKIRKPIPIREIMPLRRDDEPFGEQEQTQGFKDFEDWQMPEPA